MATNFTPSMPSNWGVTAVREDSLTALERFALDRGIPESEWISSAAIKSWVRKHRHSRYVPEYLLVAWGWEDMEFHLSSRYEN